MKRYFQELLRNGGEHNFIKYSFAIVSMDLKPPSKTDAKAIMSYSKQE